MGVTDAVRRFYQRYRLLDQQRVLCLHLQNLNQSASATLGGLAQVVDHHQTELTLVDVFALVPFGLFHLLTLQVEDIILNLEGHTQILNHFAKDFLLGRRSSNERADELNG